MLAWAALRQFESKTVDALDSNTGKDRHFRGDLFRQATVNATTIAGVLTFGVFPHHYPVNLVTIDQWALYPRQHTSRTHVGVLIEALADRQTQAPQGNMIRDVKRTHGAKENRIEGF